MLGEPAGRWESPEKRHPVSARAAGAQFASSGQAGWFPRDTPYSLVFASTQGRFHSPKMCCDPLFGKEDSE